MITGTWNGLGSVIGPNGVEFPDTAKQVDKLSKDEQETLRIAFMNAFTFDEIVTLYTKAAAVWLSNVDQEKRDAGFKYLADAKKNAKGSKTAYMQLVENVGSEESPELLYGMAMEMLKAKAEAKKKPKKETVPPAKDNTMMYVAVAAIAFFVLMGRK
jgi:hypothetical protein